MLLNRLKCLGRLWLSKNRKFLQFHHLVFFGDWLSTTGFSDFMTKLLEASMRRNSSRFMVSCCDICRNSYKTAVLKLARIVDYEERIGCDSDLPSSANLNVYHPSLLAFFLILAVTG